VLVRVRRQGSWFATVGPALTIAEVVAVLLAGLVAGALGGVGSPWPVLVAALVAVVVARAADLHRPRLVLSLADDLPGLLVGAVAATVALLVADRASTAFPVLAMGALVLAHALVYGATHLLRRSGRLRRRVLIVGTGPAARELALTLIARPDYGLSPVGLVGTGDRGALGQARGLPLALLGLLSALPRIVADEQVDTVVFALSDPGGAAVTTAVEGCLATSVDVYAVPTHLRAPGTHARHARERVGDITVVPVHRKGAWAPIRAVRRLTEVVVAGVTLAAILPVAALIGVLVRIETGGVLVAQTRIDALGQPRMVPRFRTQRARSMAVGPIGRLLIHTRLEKLPALVQELYRRMVHPPGAGTHTRDSATAPRTHQAQIDAGQLAS